VVDTVDNPVSETVPQPTPPPKKESWLFISFSLRLPLWKPESDAEPSTDKPKENNILEKALIPWFLFRRKTGETRVLNQVLKPVSSR
jgi:hypothetical protein